MQDRLVEQPGHFLPLARVAVRSSETVRHCLQSLMAPKLVSLTLMQEHHYALFVA